VEFRRNRNITPIVTGELIGTFQGSNHVMTFTRTFQNGALWIFCANETNEINLK
jgi:hypothetical protein